MHFIYVDESGISSREPVTLVLGIIVNADSQMRRATAAVAELNATVPDALRSSSFVSHAAEIWSSPKYKAHWDEAGRLKFLCEMMAIPARLDLAIAWATVRRDANVPTPHPPGFGKADVQQALAFGMCMATADRYLRDICGPEEVGFIVAEEVGKIRKAILHNIKILKTRETIIKQERLTVSGNATSGGKIDPTGDLVLKISNIIEEPHFTPKDGSVLLQISDACAYGMRRCLSDTVRAPFLEAFNRAIAGGNSPAWTEQKKHYATGLIGRAINGTAQARTARP